MMQGAQFLNISVVLSNFFLLQEVAYNVFSLLLKLLTLSLQDGLYLRFRLCGSCEVNPRRLYLLRFRRQNLYLVTALQFMAKRHKFMIYLCPDTMTSEEGMDGECEIECRTILRHGLDFAFRCKYKYFGCEKIQFDGVEEVERIRLRVIKYFFDGLEPFGQFAFVFATATFFIFPVSSEALFGYIVHAFATNLDFNPLSLVAHQRNVESLITIGFRMTYPVAKAVGMRLVYFRYGYVNIKAVVQLLFHVIRSENDSDRQDIVYFFE